LPVLSWVILAVIFLLLGWPQLKYALLVLFIVSLYPLFEFLNWRFNLWAVTNLRVVDESGFFSRYSKESPLDKINNVEFDQSLWGRMLGYGDVDIQTAAEMGETTYSMIHHPKLLKDTITHAQEEYKKAQIASQATQLAEAIKKTSPSMQQSAPQQMVGDELGKLFELLQKGAITQEEYIAQKNKLMGT
jgi:uncharacterized membrane protein YdbT with pleckstrin-like domain